MKIIWCMLLEIWSATGRIFFSFWTIFCSFTPLAAQKVKILKKWKNDLEISSFYNSVPKIMIICCIVPEIWRVANVIIFHLGPFFLPFYPLTAWKIKIKKKKIPGDTIILYKCTKNHDHMLHCYWDMVRDKFYFYFSFCTIFCPIILLTAQNSKFKKNLKKSWRDHHFTYVYQKLWSDDVRFSKYGAQRTNEQTDGQKKWHIEVGAPSKK